MLLLKTYFKPVILPLPASAAGALTNELLEAFVNGPPASSFQFAVLRGPVAVEYQMSTVAPLVLPMPILPLGGIDKPSGKMLVTVQSSGTLPLFVTVLNHRNC